MKDPLLNQLRQQLRAAQPVPAPKPAVTTKAAAPEEDVDDATLFARATRGVSRIETSDTAPAVSSERKKRLDHNMLYRRAVATAEEDVNAPLSDTAALLRPVQAETPLSYARNGISQRVLQKLRQGQPVWQAAVDLHGCNSESAREAVLQLLNDAKRDQLQVVKIVHGKGAHTGQTLLKTYVNGWLPQLPDVLAFVSALPRDGGAGAVYVLLRRQAPQSLDSDAHR